MIKHGSITLTLTVLKSIHFPPDIELNQLSPKNTACKTVIEHLALLRSTE